MANHEAGTANPAGSHRVDGHGAAGEHRCSLSSLLQEALGEHGTSSASEEMHFLVKRVLAGAVLVHEESPFHNLYLVKAGMFKFVHCDEEGYEQVLGFAVKGDVIGMDGLANGRYAASMIALEDSSAVVIPFQDVRRLGGRVPAVEAFLHQCTSRELRRGLECMQLVCAVGAEVRLARFLLQMSHRHATMGQSSRRFVLRMSRRDIASYLGLAHETVSRAFTALAQGGYLRVSQRDIEIVDISGLQSFQRSTRRLGETDAGESPTCTTGVPSVRGRRPKSPRCSVNT